MAMSARRRWFLGLLVGGAVALGGVAWWFEPQAAFFDDEVDEALPVAAGETGERDAAAAPPEAAALTRLGEGMLRGVKGHSMRGTAVVVDDGSGTRYLRFEDLQGDNGPDLVVYLSAATAEGDADAHDDDVVELGKLKGNIGSSNYELPAGVDLERYRTAVIWCRRFSVGFAVAALA